jgi:hypothetical protein
MNPQPFLTHDLGHFPDRAPTPVAVVFSFHQAVEAARRLPRDGMILCVAPPRAEYCASAADAHAFFAD